MAKYAKCPRCELNYIDILKQQYCEVCQKEMKGLTDDDDLAFFSDEEEEEELCPVCGENMMRAGETMCDECKSKSSAYDDTQPDDVDMETDEEWRNYLDDEPSEAEELDLGPADLDDEEEEEEDEETEEEEDFEYVTGDDIYKYSGDEDDEDDEEDDEDDDFDEKPSRRGRKAKDDDDDF